MSFGADEEILQDFLVEAGEILEQLSEQLVELESRPDDADLLNAIFRGFHTVKGGAGFLQLNELVECCHIAENVFDILRKGERRVDAELMDVVLEALDTVNSMFGQVRERSDVTPATPELLAALSRLAEPPAAEAPAAVAAPVAEAPADEVDITDSEFEQLLDSLDAVKAEAEAAAEQLQGETLGGSGDEITDAQFESLLDQLHGKGQFSPEVAAAEPQLAAAIAPVSDEITDEEFESLLDQLHGKGTFQADALPAAAAVASEAPAASSEEISEHEFEALLDQLHGKGKFSGSAAAAEVPAAVAAPVAARAEVAPVAKP
ncbi:Hpt domain-containing protein, partial [Pseudomonas plecoglossicida]